ncbi:MAG: beta-ketoacyl-[acyl-carrier-protein] synthase family protein [Acidobacteria bacterium]|nr:beta-ketoacyl-[acyl-carrier-protein] synthase family protein [Acidobacteriota bacterium]
MTSVAITGLGCVSALGENLAVGWPKAMAGAETIATIGYFDASVERSDIAAQAPIHQLHWPYGDEPHSRTDLMSLVAAEEAVSQSGLHDRIAAAGVFMGAGTGGLHVTERLFERDRTQVGRLNGHDYLIHNGDVSAQWIAHHFRLRGPARSVMTACSSSVLAIGEAIDQIRLGELEIAIAGGADSITRLTHSGFNSLQAVDAKPCRPFEVNRAGMNLGECAAFMILESAEHAQERGARILAWIRGYGLSCDAHHMTAPPDDGNGAVRAIRAALKDACIAPGRVQLVNAHATATPLNDIAETRALNTVFETRQAPLWVTGTKCMTGHCLGAAGAIEAVLTVMSLHDQCVPPTLRCHQSELQEPLRLVTQPHFHAKLEYAISNSFAFGGNNGVLVFERGD